MAIHQLGELQPDGGGNPLVQIGPAGVLRLGLTAPLLGDLREAVAALPELRKGDEGPSAKVHGIPVRSPRSPLAKTSASHTLTFPLNSFIPIVRLGSKCSEALGCARGPPWFFCT